MKRIKTISLGAAGVCLGWRFLLLNGKIPIDGNMATIAFPNWAAARWYFENGIFPLWNPWRNMGEPFLADPQTMAASPLLWLLIGFSDFHQFLSLWYVIHTLLAAIFMGALAKRLYKNDVAALTAGILGGLNGFLLSHLSPNVFATAAMLPAALYFSHRRSWIGLGAVLGMQWLAGFPDFVILTVLLSCLPLLEEGRAGAVLVLRAGLLALGLAAIQMIPFLEFLSLSVRGLLVDSQSAVQFSMPPVQLLKELFAPLWTSYSPQLKDDPAITAFYVGLPAIVMAVIGAWKGKLFERRWALAAGTALLLSLGSYLPGFSALRFLHFFCYPAHWLLIANTGIVLLAAAGMTHVKKRTAYVVTALIAMDLLIFAQTPRIAWFEPSFLTEPPPLAQTLRSQPYRMYHTEAFERSWQEQTMLTAEHYQRYRAYLPPSYGMAFGIADVRSHQVLSLKRTQVFHERLAAEGPRSPLVQIAGIKTVVTLQEGVTELDRSGRLLEMANPQPPFSFALKHPKNRVHLQKFIAGKAEAEASVTTPALLIFNQVFYPGWEFWVNGRKRTPELFEDTFFALPLELGEHRITATYKPRSLLLGCWISLATLLFLVWRWALGRRK